MKKVVLNLDDPDSVVYVVLNEPDLDDADGAVAGIFDNQDAADKCAAHVGGTVWPVEVESTYEPAPDDPDLTADLSTILTKSWETPL